MMRICSILTALMLSGLSVLSVAQPRRAVVAGPASLGAASRSVAQVIKHEEAATNNQRMVGYTVTDSITVRDAAFGNAGTYTVGALMPAKMLSAYEGCRVLGIRVASGMPLGRTRMFIYELKDSELSPVIEQKQRLYEGWNSVFFNGDGYTIKGTETLFFGFDYVETDEMVKDDKGALCGFGNDVDGAFYVYGDFGGGTALYSVSSIGCLCVQLIVDVSTLPVYDLDLQSADAGFRYKEPGENVEVLLNYANVGRAPVHSFQYGYSLDGQEPVYKAVKDTMMPGGHGSLLFDFDLSDEIAVGMHRLDVFLSQVENEAVAPKSKNDTISSSFAVYRNSMVRNLCYLEVYTDQNSAYVPFLNDAVKMLAAKSYPFTYANIHRPGTALAVAEAAYLHELYAYDWPTFTANRSYFPGEPYIAYDMNDYLPVVPAEMIAGILGDIVLQDAASPSFASLDLSASYDQTTRLLKVETKGKLLPEAEAIYGKMGLTLMLVENDVKESQAVYNSIMQRTSINKNYYHNRVLRGYMTKPTGDVLPVSQGDYTMSSEITLKDEWKPENMSVVALLTRYAETVTDDNVLEMDVVNADNLDLITLPTLGIQTPLRHTLSQQYYTIDGKLVHASQLKSGVYVVRQADGTTRKIVLR